MLIAVEINLSHWQRMLRRELMARRSVYDTLPMVCQLELHHDVYYSSIMQSLLVVTMGQILLWYYLQVCPYATI